MIRLSHDRFKEEARLGIDCIMLTLNAEPHLQETLDAWYKDAPIRRLLVIDGGSKDDTVRILGGYPRVDIWVYPGMTTGKAWEILKRKVQTPWFIWIDVGKIPRDGWYDEMTQHMDEGDLLGSLRMNYKAGELVEDPIIRDPVKRLLGGPWLIRTMSLACYHVDDDYVQRNLDIVIRKQLEDAGGRYHLVTSASHLCYLPIPVTDEVELKRRHLMNAKGIVKYITPEYARTNASYLLDDHWMLMMNTLSRKWIMETNPDWLPVIQSWRRHRLLIAKAERFLYHTVMRR